MERHDEGSEYSKNPFPKFIVPIKNFRRREAGTDGNRPCRPQTPPPEESSRKSCTWRGCVLRPRAKWSERSIRALKEKKCITRIKECRKVLIVCLFVWGPALPLGA